MTEYSRGWLANRISGWVNATLQYPLLVVLIVFALTGSTLYYTLTHFSINTNTNDMLSTELQFRKDYARYQQEFPQTIDTFLVVIDGDIPELARDATDRLASLLRANHSLYEDVYTPASSRFFDRTAFLYLDIDQLEQLTDNLARIQPFLAALTQDQTLSGLLGMLELALTAVKDGEDLDLAPMLRELNTAIDANLHQQQYRLSWQKLMLSGDDKLSGKRQYIIVKPRLDFSQWSPAEPAIQEVRRIATALNLNRDHGVSIRLTGILALEHEEMLSISEGMALTGMLALIMVLVVLWLAFRSWVIVLATLITLISGLVLTAGFATFAVGELNLISIAFAVLYIGLGVDFAIHLGLRYTENLRQGLKRKIALIRASTNTGPSLILCVFTTAAGFYAFIPTDYEGVSQLGIVAGTGMFISLFITLTLFPPLLRLLPTPALPVATDGFKSLPNRLALWPVKHAAAIRRGSLLAAGIGLVLLPYVKFDYNALNVRDPNSESVATFKDLINTSETPPWGLVVLSDNPERTLELADRLAELPSVENSVTLADFIPQDQPDKLMLIEDIALILGTQFSQARKPSTSRENQFPAVLKFHRALDEYLDFKAQLPWRTELSMLTQNLEQLIQQHEANPVHGQQALSNLEHSLIGTLPQSLQKLHIALQAGSISPGDLPQDLHDRWITSQGVEKIDVFPAKDISDSETLHQFVEEVKAIAPGATDYPVLSLESGNAIIKAFKQAFTGAFVIITALLLLNLRNVKRMVWGLTPLLLSAVLTGAATVAFDIPFNFANIIALPLLLGIGVDSAIHLIHRFQQSASGINQLLCTSTARAVFFSALTTIVSFGNLGFSAHAGTASMGVLLTIGVLFTMVSTLVVLPAWLVKHSSTL